MLKHILPAATAAHLGDFVRGVAKPGARIEDSAARADELAGESNHHGAAIWRLITDAVAQLANTTPTEPLH